MEQPLAFIPQEKRYAVFLALLGLTALLFAVFLVLDVPLRTEAAPSGIVSFELAGTVQRAGEILASWGTLHELGAYSVFQPNIIRAAFGLGLDYLFMPSYALTFSLAAALAADRRGGLFRSAGTWMGWAPLIAAVFDALENYALLRLLLGAIEAPWPQLAAWCAGVKFALVGLTLLYALAGWLLPQKSS